MHRSRCMRAAWALTGGAASLRVTRAGPAPSPPAPTCSAASARTPRAPNPPHTPPAAPTPTRRAPPGSTRLYEDPDIDEYDGFDDAGYWRREVPRQDEFIATQLERVKVRTAGGGCRFCVGSGARAPSDQLLHVVTCGCVSCCVGARRRSECLCRASSSDPLTSAQDDESSVDMLCGYGLQMGASSSGAATPASASTPGGAFSQHADSRSPSSSASLSSPGGGRRALA